MNVLLKILLVLSFSLNFAWAQGSLKSDAVKLWQKRDVKESLAEAIGKFEQLHAANPADTEIFVYLIRSNFLMGDSHSSNKDEKLKYFEKAFKYGDTALEMNKDYAAKIKKGDDIEDVVKALTASEVPQMFWTAASIGRFAKTTGIFASMKYKGKILALISRVEELQPTFFYGSVYRYWGSYYAVIPRLAGRDLKKSKKNFEKAMELAPDYLGTKVLMAETYEVEKDDKKDFKQLLNEVIQDTTHDKHPELGPENRMEKIKAKKLLDNIDDLF